MTTTHSSRANPISSALLFRLNDKKARKFWGLLTTIAIMFLIYTAALLNLPILWKYRALSPSREQSPINSLMPATIPTLDFRALKQRYFDFTRPIAVDVWFALAFMPALDAITVVGSCNRPVIDHWHYFVSIRMMALASLASFTILLSRNPTTYVSQYPGMVCILTLVTYGLVGLCLDRFHAPPPKRSTNLRKWSLSEYANVLCRSRGTWRAAMASTAVTCGLGTVLTALIPGDWSTIIPVITTGFEAVFLRLDKFGRTSQYTVCAAPFFQGGVCVHWGLRQVMASPFLVLPPWAFLCLLVASRLVLDLHLHTIFRHYPEFHWARRNAVIPTSTLIQAVAMLLALEEMQLGVIRYIKPTTVVMLYSASIMGVAMPAAYNIAFERFSKKQN